MGHHDSERQCWKEYEDKLAIQLEFWKQRSRSKWDIWGDQPPASFFSNR